MKETIRLLQKGWYGNLLMYLEGHPLQKHPVNCSKLWNKCLEIAGTKFVTMCEGISGKIGALNIDTTYQSGTPVLPIDTLVSHLLIKEEESGFMAEESEVGGELVVGIGRI